MIRFTDQQMSVCSRVLWGKNSKLSRKEYTVCHWVMTYLLNKGVPLNELESKESLALNLQYEMNKELKVRDYDDFIVGCVCGLEEYKKLSYGVPTHIDVEQPDITSPMLTFSIVYDTKPYIIEKDPSPKQNLIDGRKQIICALLLGYRNPESELDKFLVEYVYSHVWMIDEEGRNTPSSVEGFLEVWSNYLQGAIDGEPYEDYVVSMLSDIDSLQLVTLEGVRKYVVIKPYETGFRRLGVILTSLNDMNLPFDKEEDFTYKNIKVKKDGEE